MQICFEPIGWVRTDATSVPRHWSVSDVAGELEIKPELAPGLANIKPGQKIVVLFYFHQSRTFEESALTQTPPHRSGARGVFSICSPRRPNPIGMSILQVAGVNGNTVKVKGLDMYDGTPILDIKPHITGEYDCPSRA